MPEPRQPDRLLLASASPRRRQLLREAGYRFEATSPPFVEPDDKHPRVDPALHAESLAYFKARSVANENRDRTILAADTIALLENDIIGKPADRDDARNILMRLSNTSHQVITGLVLFDPATSRRLFQHDVSTVRLRPLKDETIDAYLDTGQWEGKAGAYGIQDHSDAFVEEVEGSYTNVVGLPMEKLAAMFDQWMLDTADTTQSES